MDLQDLYQQTLLDHGKRPRNFGPLPEATHRAEGYNPMCGDEVRLALLVEGDVVREARFEGCGCAISQASASMMTQAVKGQTVVHARELFDRFHAVVVRGEDEASDDDLGPLDCLTGVRQYPNRIKCATLAWHALKDALEGERA